MNINVNSGGTDARMKMEIPYESEKTVLINRDPLPVILLGNAGAPTRPAGAREIRDIQNQNDQQSHGLVSTTSVSVATSNNTMTPAISLIPLSTYVTSSETHVRLPITTNGTSNPTAIMRSSDAGRDVKIVITMDNSLKMEPHEEQLQSNLEIVMEKGFQIPTTVFMDQSYAAMGEEEEEVEHMHEHDINDMQVVELTEAETCASTEGILPCLVCGDRGSGFHYSVYSCEGCKGFFKRTVQRNMVYVCKESGNCGINKATRNNCQYCRFQKCMDVGMKKDAVREDRTPGGKHRMKKARFGDMGEEGDGNEVEVPLDGNYSTSYLLDNLEEDEELLSRLADARPDIVPGPEDLFAGQNVSGGESNAGGEDNELDINVLMQLGYMELRIIIEWARKVPGFSDLLLEDQMALLKSSFMELNVLRLAYRSLDCPGYVKFASHILLAPHQCMNLGWGQDLINCTLEFISRLRDIDIDNTEFCILNAVVLTYPDAAGVVDKPSVSSLQNQMLECLQRYSTARYPDKLHRYGKILLRLPALRTVSAKAGEKFLSLSLEGNVRMNALVLEMMN